MHSSITTIAKLFVMGLVTSGMLALAGCNGDQSPETVGTEIAAGSAENSEPGVTEPVASEETVTPLTGAKKDTPVQAQPAISEERQQDYKNAVRSQMKRSLKSGLIRDYGITEDQADCLVENLSVSQLKTAQTDLEAQAKIKECGVEPSLIK